MTTSIKATALEPDPSLRRQRSRACCGRIGRQVPVYGLPVLTLGLIAAVLAAAAADTFPTLFNLRSILATSR